MSDPIDALLPQAGSHDEASLLALAPEVLARYVCDVAHPWWRRRACVRALAGRVPDAHVEHLFARVRDPSETTEVRVALLAVLPLREAWLPWLQGEHEDVYGLHEAIIEARATLGDVTAIAAAATMAASPWWHRREKGERALDALITRYGLETVESAVGTERPEDRLFHVRMLARRGDDLLHGFADPDRTIAAAACDLAVKSTNVHDEALLDYVATGPTLEARLWAIVAIHLRGRDDIWELWDALDNPHVDIPGLPADVRGAILHHYEGIPPTDPRWLVERICSGYSPPNEDKQLAHAVAALEAAGLSPEKPVSAGESWGQGGGTYHIIKLAEGAVSISTLGPFAIGEAPPLAQRTLMAAGFRWIEPALAQLKVEGLSVYFFGSREPLSVYNLLFYWQD